MKTKTLIMSLLILKGTYAQDISKADAMEQRSYMIATLTKIAHPVLYNLSKNELKKNMPIENQSEKSKASHLEAFARTLSGIAPWLELGPDNTEEGKIRKTYIDLTLRCLKNATDKNAADYLEFGTHRQTLVDAAFLAEGLLRAPTQIWGALDQQTKQNVIEALKATRSIKPLNNNWLLFTSIVETALLKFEGTCNFQSMDHGIKKHLEWFKGDGVYGDGPNFHFDYYNSFVIHPMMLEILQGKLDAGIKDSTNLYNVELKRAQKYTSILEKQISPEATYPAVGRSIVYRFGALHILSKMALMNKLPSGITPNQVRYALYNVIKKQIEAPGTFDENNWLKIGFYGHQPRLAESYISTGSLYLCLNAFLILGLPPTDKLWQAPNTDWSSRKVWSYN